MHAVDDTQSPNSAEHDHNSSALRQQRRRSSGDSRITVRFKLATPSLSAAEVGSVVKVTTGDEEKITATKEKLNIMKEERPPVTVVPSPTKPETILTPVNSKKEQETACNAPPQPTISITNCKKKSARLRRNWGKTERVKFSVSLSRHEIEHDFIVITGKKPPGKPKKRPRVMQNQINAIFPCQCLTEVHVDHYKVKDNGKQ